MKVSVKYWWNDNDWGKPNYSAEETCPCVKLSTMNLTRSKPGSNPGLQVAKPAPKPLSHGTAWS